MVICMRYALCIDEHRSLHVYMYACMMQVISTITDSCMCICTYTLMSSNACMHIYVCICWCAPKHSMSTCIYVLDVNIFAYFWWAPMHACVSVQLHAGMLACIICMHLCTYVYMYGSLHASMYCTPQYVFVCITMFWFCALGVRACLYHYVLISAFGTTPQYMFVCIIGFRLYSIYAFDNKSCVYDCTY
jgi:hypothetical protein